ncbi:MAG TPA: PqqD family peptide modification chaperone [Arachnia sp.]|nr:PqqD family peptide modification chaperone [Arachnia sp.]
MIRRSDLTDFLPAAGESLVLLDDKVLRLGPVATLILEVLGNGPVTLEQLTDELSAAFGTPPDGSLTEAVAAQLGALNDNGLLIIDEEPAGQDTSVTQ